MNEVLGHVEHLCSSHKIVNSGFYYDLILNFDGEKKNNYIRTKRVLLKGYKFKILWDDVFLEDNTKMKVTFSAYDKINNVPYYIDLYKSL